MDYDNLKSFRNSQNHFANLTGVKTLEIRKGYAKCALELRGEHFNVINSVHGGALYTLMDCTGGAAATSYGNRVTTLSSSEEFLNPVLTPQTLYGIGRVIKHGRNISVIDVRVTDIVGKTFCKGTFTYYNLDKESSEEKNEEN